MYTLKNMETKKSSKSTKRTYRRYTPEFKAEAVKQLERGVPVAEVSEFLGVKPGVLHNWKAKAKQPAVVREQAEEVKRLTKELKVRDQQIDILKKPPGASSARPVRPDALYRPTAPRLSSTAAL